MLKSILHNLEQYNEQNSFNILINKSRLSG